MKTDPEYLFPFDIDLNNPPPFPKPLNAIMRKRRDKVGVKKQQEYSDALKKYTKWLDEAKWYLALKSYDIGRVTDEIAESFSKVSRGIYKAVALYSAFNQIKAYYKRNPKR